VPRCAAAKGATVGRATTDGALVTHRVATGDMLARLAQPGHDGHMHVRFKCPESDAKCQ
jgi:murein endopeptidase